MNAFASVICVVSFSACASGISCWIGVAAPLSAVGAFFRVKKAPTADNGAATPIQQLMPLAQALNETTQMTDAKAFIRWLDQQSSVAKNRKIGTQGYCMGGPIAFRTAAAVPDRVGAIASFHGGGLVTTNPNSPHLQAAKTKAQFLIAIAANDDQRAPT